MRVAHKGEKECYQCQGTGWHYDWGCMACGGSGKIPTLTYKEVSPEDQVTEQINQWYNGR